MGTAPEWLVDFYRCVDGRDVDGVANGFAPDGTMLFNAAPPLAGRDAIRGGVSWIYSSYHGISHAFTNVWTIGDTTILEATVTYTCLDSRQVPVPTVTVLDRRDGLITCLRIFNDMTLLAPPA